MNYAHPELLTVSAPDPGAETVKSASTNELNCRQVEHDGGKDKQHHHQ